MLNTQKIIEYYKQLLQYVEKINNKQLSNLIQDFDQQLLLAPNSIYDQYGGCYQGGWVQHCIVSLHLSDKEYNLLIEVIKQECSDVNIEKIITFDKNSIYKTIILSNLSKVGQPGISGFIKKQKRGTYGKNTIYDFNMQLQRMRYQDRSIYLANKYDIKLTRQQMKALLSASRLNSQQKSFYFLDYLDLQHLSQTMLSTLVAICNFNAFKILKFKQVF